jgi:plasmid stabilization system protein ParE
MMRIEWLQSALNELAAVWARADSARRKAITAASHQIDRRLANNPQNEGESRSGTKRILFVGPLIVYFRIEAGGRTVTILGVRESRRSGR